MKEYHIILPLGPIEVIKRGAYHLEEPEPSRDLRIYDDGDNEVACFKGQYWAAFWVLDIEPPHPQSGYSTKEESKEITPSAQLPLPGFEGY